MASPITFILLGNSDAGKSASGNTILRRAAFESKRSFSSVTTEISERVGTVLGMQISVIDTPGILGPDVEEEESNARENPRTEVKIKNHCDKLLQEGRSCLFLIVVKIGRFTKEQKEAVEAALRVIGEEQLKNSYLLFTGEDTLGTKTLKEFINEKPKGFLPKLVNDFEERYHIFNNKSGGEKQVRELLRKAGHLRPGVGSMPSAKPKKMRIVLLGLPGVGKSASGNTILGLQSQPNRFESAGGFTSVTKETVSKSAEVEGHQITVVDTPGITGEGWAPKELFDEIMKSIEAANPGPHAFIFVVKFDRILKAHEKLFKLLTKLFNKDAPKYSMVLITHGDELQGGNIDEKISANNAVSTLVRKCGGRYCVFNNRDTDRQQVGELLVKINQMVTANGGHHYTSDLFRDVQTIPVALSIRWHEICEWFVKYLQNLNCCRKPVYESDDENDDQCQALSLKNLLSTQ